MNGTPRDYYPQDDVWVMALVLGSFLLLVLLLGHQRRYIGSMAHKFFLPTNREEKPKLITTWERLLPFFASITMIVSSGLLLYVYIHQAYRIEDTPLGRWGVMGVCLGVFATYHLLRWLLYSFVNWVFFDHRKKRQWMAGYELLLLGETIVTFLLMCAGMFFHLKLLELGWAVAICYGMLRFPLISYTKRIFFPKIYGLLHLIAYLCTLEALPLLVLWKFCEFSATTMALR